VQVGDTVLRIEVYDPVAATLPATAAPGANMLVRCRCGAISSEVARQGDDVVYLCAQCHQDLALAPVLPAGFELVRTLGRVAIGCQALDGLAHAHAKQIVHRDIKEANLMLLRGSTLTVKVADFGLAKNFHKSGASGMTADGALGGTLAYMPKEQLLDFKYVKPPADIYALGATLYRLLTGEYPRDYKDG